MKKKIALILLCFVAVTVLWGYPLAQAETTEREEPTISDKAFTSQTDDQEKQVTYEDFKGKRFAVMTGSV